LGEGLGRTLAEALVGAAFNEHPIDNLHLIVRKNNLVAQHLYRAMGFCQIGETTRLILGFNVLFFKFVMSRDQFNQKRKTR